ncbi:MAG: glycosyltransferase [Candidatus Omnitrophica bacterium]|nr:glycosyltransferase [Candidatus Omnitrophota bacterium]
MKISGFTIARNVIKYNYPVIESINSILPICDEFIVNIGDSSDGTEALLKELKSPKIRIIRNRWDMSLKSETLSQQTNLALKECKGDWAFYLQSDEVVHEKDLSRLFSLMKNNLNNQNADALRFYWLHFYGSFYRYRIDSGWYQKQDRIIRNNNTVESYGDAYGFRRTDKRPLGRVNTGCFIYHYGWVQPRDLMMQRRINAEEIGFVSLDDKKTKKEYEYGDLGRFPPYFGSHPKAMAEIIIKHSMSVEDLKRIDKEFWWHPAKILRLRYKTFNRVKQRID